MEFEKRKFLIDILNDFSPLQCILKAPQIGMTTINLLKTFYVAKKLHRDIVYCVDTKTEALTKRGFLSYDQITLSDELLTLSLDGKTQWSRVKEIFSKDVTTTMYDYSARNFNALTTHNHRWIVHNKKGDYRITTSEKLHKENYFIPKIITNDIGKEVYSDDYVRLLAWVFSEGTYPKQISKFTGKPKGHSIHITQSEKVNADKCVEIRRVLKSCGVDWKERPQYNYLISGCIDFKFAFEIAKNIRERFPDKIPDAEFACSLSSRQAKIFIETFVSADGWIDKSGTSAIIQKNKKCVDVINMIAVIAGYSPSVVKPSVNNCYTIRMTQFPDIYTSELKPKIIDNWRGIVWCPRTDAGTFYARRNGRCYWTGNTLPTETDVREMAGGKINRIIAQNPLLKSWTKDHDTIEQKSVGGNIIYYRGCFTARAAMMVSSQLNAHDEVDASDQMIITQYETRQQAESGGWRWYWSHPSLAEYGIDVYWNQSDQKHWFITCPKCLKQQFMSWPESINKLGFYQCKHCSEPLEDSVRQDGLWVPKYNKDWQSKNIIKPFSGYWINQMMCSWITAEKILKDFNEKPPQYFYNYVLGLPYSGGDSKLTEGQLKQNCTGQMTIPEANEPVVMGVDTGLKLDFVIGNKRLGLFYHGDATSYSTLDDLMRRWPKMIAVVDAGGDLIGSRAFYERFKGRVFLCYFTGERKTNEIAWWGEGERFGEASVDRERVIQWVVDEFRTARIPLQGTREDWHDYYLDWANLSRIKQVDPVTRQIKGIKWVRNGRDHRALATCLWRIGLERFPDTSTFVSPHK